MVIFNFDIISLPKLLDLTNPKLFLCVVHSIASWKGHYFSQAHYVSINNITTFRFYCLRYGIYQQEGKN